jgi:hypothetical protein
MALATRPKGYVIDVPITLSVAVRGASKENAKEIARAFAISLQPHPEYIAGFNDISTPEIQAGAFVTEVSLESSSEDPCEVLEDLEEETNEEMVKTRRERFEEYMQDVAVLNAADVRENSQELDKYLVIEWENKEIIWMLTVPALPDAEEYLNQSDTYADDREVVDLDTGTRYRANVHYTIVIPEAK